MMADRRIFADELFDVSGAVLLPVTLSGESLVTVQ